MVCTPFRHLLFRCISRKRTTYTTVSLAEITKTIQPPTERSDKGSRPSVGFCYSVCGPNYLHIGDEELPFLGFHNLLDSPGEPTMLYTSWIKMFESNLVAITADEMPERRKRALLRVLKVTYYTPSRCEWD